MLEAKGSLAQAIHVVGDDSGPRLHLLSRGREPVVAPDVFRSVPARTLITGLRDEYDLVLLDCPPLLQVAYSNSLVGFADGVIVVVEHDSPIAELEEVARRLEIIGTPIVGYVYNRAPLRPEMVASGGSMKDVLGDRGVVEPMPRRGRRGKS